MVASLVMSADAQFTVLQLSDHGNARREDHLYGGWHRRFLNAAGRWSSVGTKEVPLIAWPDEGTAAQAANIASQARGRDVSVCWIGPAAAAGFTLFDEALRSALLGYLPYSAASARKLEAERLKTMRYAAAVLGTFDADGSDAIVESAHAAAVTLHRQYGGGSVVSAAQYLTGKRAAHVIEQVLDDELACSDGLTPTSLVRAVAIATGMVERLGAKNGR